MRQRVHLDNESETIISSRAWKSWQKTAQPLRSHIGLSTIRNADEILVVAENGIEERGTHEELLEKGGIYAHYYEMM